MRVNGQLLEKKSVYGRVYLRKYNRNVKWESWPCRIKSKRFGTFHCSEGENVV